MGSDFYTDDYAYGSGGGYYDGGGSIDYGFDTTSWPTFDEYYGSGGLPPDYAPGFDPSSGLVDLGGGYGYDPSTGGILDTGLWQGFDGSQVTGDDLWRTEYEGWIAFGLDPASAASQADQALEEARASAGAINISQSASELTKSPELPDIGQYFPLPFVSTYKPWQSPPYIPTFPNLPAPQPPVPRLPGYCPQGTYHPIDDPYSCVPFPQATTNQQQQQQQQRPGQQSSSGSEAQASRPQQQQQQQQQQPCPTGYCKHPQTGRCIPIPQGYARHPQTQVCTPQTAQASPLPIPSEAGDLWANLKGLPWWVWLAVGGLFLLSRDDDGRTTTVRYRRAS